MAHVVSNFGFQIKDTTQGVKRYYGRANEVFKEALPITNTAHATYTNLSNEFQSLRLTFSGGNSSGKVFTVTVHPNETLSLADDATDNKNNLEKVEVASTFNPLGEDPATPGTQLIALGDNFDTDTQTQVAPTDPLGSAYMVTFYDN